MIKTVKIKTTPYIVYHKDDDSTTYIGINSKGKVKEIPFSSGVPYIAFRADRTFGGSIHEFIYILDDEYLIGFSAGDGFMSENWELTYKVTENNINIAVNKFNNGSNNTRGDIEYILEY